MARRRRGLNSASPTGVQSFAQSGEQKSNYGLQAKRAMSGHAGNTGEASIVGAYRKRRNTASAGGSSLNFARRKRSVQRARVNQDPQKPAASSRQYGFPTLGPIVGIQR